MPKLENERRMPSTEPRMVTCRFAGTSVSRDDLVDTTGKAAEVLPEGET